MCMRWNDTDKGQPPGHSQFGSTRKRSKSKMKIQSKITRADLNLTLYLALIPLPNLTLHLNLSFHDQIAILWEAPTHLTFDYFAVANCDTDRPCVTESNALADNFLEHRRRCQ